MKATGSTQEQEKQLSQQDRDEIGRLLPTPLWMADLVRPIEAWAVRMKRFDKKNNQVFGAMVWPEVLLCKNEPQAERMRSFLEDASFQDYMESIREEEPEAKAEDHRSRWMDTDLAQYVIEYVEDISKYDEIERVGESLSTLVRLFPTLDAITAMRRLK